MKVIIVGGGAAGLFAALLLARADHQVIVFEQDHLEPLPDIESAGRLSIPLDGAADRAAAHHSWLDVGSCCASDCQTSTLLC